MNKPGVALGNWEWRFSASLPLKRKATALREELARYRRIVL
jgi:4-alpha-glucanotransferase